MVRSVRQQFLFLLIPLFLAVIIRLGIALAYPEGGFAVHPAFHDEFYRWHFDHLYDKPWTRFGELLLGVGVAFLYSRPEHFVRLTRYRRALGFGAVICSSSIFFDVPAALMIEGPTSVFTLTFMQITFSLGVSFFILLGLSGESKDWWCFRILGKRFWHPLAQISYSLYLIHPIVIWFFFQANHVALASRLSDLNVLLIAGFILSLSLSFSVLTYLAIERPFLNLRDSLPKF